VKGVIGSIAVLLLFYAAALLLVLMVSGCRVIEVVRPDGTRLRAMSFLTQPEIAEADVDPAGRMKLKGYASRDAEIVGAAVRAAVGAAQP
jgi:hypothetical protein